MDQEQYTNQLLQFLASSPTAFHTVQTISAILKDKGFTELHEGEKWNLQSGSYYVRRNGSSLIIMTLADTDMSQAGIRMAGAHTDSPGLKIKPKGESVNNGYVQLGVEVYGGALLYPWFDRDLSICGRVTLRTDDNSVRNVLIDFKRPVAIIPSLAGHLNREVNEQLKVNKQTDIVPIIMQHEDSAPDFTALLLNQVAGEHGIEQAEILEHELFLYDCQPPALIGINEEFFSGHRLDNLLSCHALVSGLVNAEKPGNSLIVLNDHEEVGSQSAIGAQGPFLDSILTRLIPDPEEKRCCLHKSLMISADNAHGVHPNFADRHDPNHQPHLNGGPVIKYNANHRYATTGKTASFFRLLTQKVGIPVQEFVMRSDMACGSTIGPLTAAETGVQTLDIGVPTLGMHSIRETAGSKDSWQLNRIMTTYFETADDDAIWQCLAD